MRKTMASLGKAGFTALCVGALALSLTGVTTTSAHAVDAMSTEGQVTASVWNRNPGYTDFFGVDSLNDGWGIDIDPNKDGSGLTIDNITSADNSAGALRYLLMGTTEYNENPNPYMYNLIYQTSGAKLLRGVSYGMGSTAGIQATATFKPLWDLRPNIIMTSAPSAQEGYLETWKSENADFADYDPTIVEVTQSPQSALIDMNYRTAAAADDIAENSNGALSLRYGPAAPIAENYERIVRGSQGYILSQLKSNNAEKKTVALVSANDGSTVTLQTEFGANSTTGDALANVAVSLGSQTLEGGVVNAEKKQVTLSIEDFKKAAAKADLIIIDGNDVGENYNNTTGLESLYSKLYWVTDTDCGGVTSVKSGSFDYAQNYMRLLGCLYPEYMTQSSDVAYYYDTLYHLKSGVLAKAIDKAMDGVRNWDVKSGSNASAYLAWGTDTVASYNKQEVEAQLTYGLAYVKSLGENAPEDLQLTDNLAAEVPDISTLKNPGAANTPVTPVPPADTAKPSTSTNNASSASTTPAGKWVKGSQGWWYSYNAGGYAKGWQKISGDWYYFTSNGWMTTGWQKVGGAWYYMKASGAMATGWQKVGGTWYYLKDSGAMATGWQKVGNTWYYLKSSGAMAVGWQKVGNTWYYLKSSGAMATGWQKVGGTWYYLKDSGAMATGWQKVGNTWYYLYGSGAMASSTRVGGYYLNASGAWVPGA